MEKEGGQGQEEEEEEEEEQDVLTYLTMYINTRIHGTPKPTTNPIIKPRNLLLLSFFVKGTLGLIDEASAPGAQGRGFKPHGGTQGAGLLDAGAGMVGTWPSSIGLQAEVS